MIIAFCAIPGWQGVMGLLHRSMSKNWSMAFATRLAEIPFMAV